MKKKLKIKGLSILMAILMVASIIPMGAISSFAADADYQCSVVSETDQTIKIEKYIGAGGDITIPSTIDGYTVIDIGIAAFENCISLTSVIIGSSVTKINSQAFYGCTGLKAINISEGNTVFSSVDGVLYSKDKASLLICPNGKSGEFIVPDSVTSIGDAAFQGCAGLKGLIIGSAVTSIGQMAFYYCTGLKSITIPDSVTSIYNNPFAGCTALTAINVTEGNKAFSSVDGVLYSKDKTQLLICSGKSDEFIVPTGVTNIGIGAFSNCYGLTNITIPNSVTNIGHGAFNGCIGLTNIVIPNSVTSIGNLAFYGCTGLKSVTIPDSVTSIGVNAFYGCTKDFKIIGKKGSIAETYATANGIIFEELPLKLGDVNGDGRVTSGDAIAVLRAEAQLRTLSAEEFTAADVVKDNRVTSGDAIRILRYEAQLVPSL